MSSLIKEINRLIRKETYVLLFDIFNGCFLVQLKKQIGIKLRFYRKENLKICTTFEKKKGTKYIRANVYFGVIVFSCLSSTKLYLRFLLIYFDREIKSFYQSTLRNEVDFMDIMNVSPNILGKN